jgi:hypothetical protein
LRETLDRGATPRIAVSTQDDAIGQSAEAAMGKIVSAS